MPYRYWTPEEMELLASQYGQRPAREIAAQLGRSLTAVEKKAVCLGLVSKAPGSKMYTGNARARRLVGPQHPQYRPPGQPWQAYGQWYIKRSATGKPERYATYLWEQLHGPVPPRHFVVHANRNQLDVRPENLILVSRADNALRNSIQRYPAELVADIRAVQRLKQKIKKLEDAK